jgi:beta-lactamase regulating signal transducer with metallopeptidase domain
MEIKTFLKTLSFMHLALVIGLSIFTVLAFTQNMDFNTETDTKNVLLYIVPIAALIGYFGSQFLFKKLLMRITDTDSLEEKLKKYQSASHLKYALIEAPAFLALFAYYNSGNALPLVIAVCLLVYLFVQKPSKQKILMEIPLTMEQRRELE